MLAALLCQGSSYGWMRLPHNLCASRVVCVAEFLALCIMKCNDEHKIFFPPVLAAQVSG